ncbi:MAG: hypothetical protein HY288_05640 [Planctomycetia bacterium]|nr:hypothetical protein [Planctomycetia bacterium]
MGAKLLLFHPQLLNRTCASCQEWLYDDQHRFIMRAGQRVSRPKGSPTPCWKCPKESPVHAAGYERDIDKIASTIDLYFRVRATAGRCLSPCEAADPLTVRKLSIVDRIVRKWELAQVACVARATVRGWGLGVGD